MRAKEDQMARPGEDGNCIHEGDECDDAEHCECFCDDCKEAYEAANAEEE
jgi:hypothetical protein